MGALSMSGELPKQELLAKLLKMTTSDSDGECLVAIRKANALLRGAGWDWDKLLAGKIRVIADPFSSVPVPPDNGGRSRTMNTPPRPAAQPTYSTPPRAQPRPAPRPAPPKAQPILSVMTIIGSTLSNRFGGTCWCCGDDVLPNNGWLFKPSDFIAGMPKPQAGSRSFELTCDPCNNNPKLNLTNMRAPRSYKTAPAPKVTATDDLA